MKECFQYSEKNIVSKLELYRVKLSIKHETTIKYFDRQGLKILTHLYHFSELAPQNRKVIKKKNQGLKKEQNPNPGCAGGQFLGASCPLGMAVTGVD